MHRFLVAFALFGYLTLMGCASRAILDSPSTEAS